MHPESCGDSEKVPCDYVVEQVEDRPRVLLEREVDRAFAAELGPGLRG
jgi:hypothetical protein